MENEIKELKTTVDELLQSQNEVQQQIEKMKKDLDESIKFQKDLIGSLQDSEKEHDCLFLPEGNYHGIEIK